MEAFINLFIQLGIPLLLLALGLTAGTLAERRHLRLIGTREKSFAEFHVSNLKSYPGGVAAGISPGVITAEVVIATDYFKSFVAGLRNIVGGEVRSYDSLMQRARREALLRLIEKANERGMDAVCNLRFDTMDIGGAASGRGKKKGVVMVCVIATCTAYKTAGAPPDAKETGLLDI